MFKPRIISVIRGERGDFTRGQIKNDMKGGLILIVLGLLNLGSVIKYIPYSVTVGFTTGIGILLITTEVPSFFGLHIKNLPNDIVGKWILY
ncbi:MAG: SulP family inorganic anion transporter [Sarcina sp.]